MFDDISTNSSNYRSMSKTQYNLLDCQYYTYASPEQIVQRVCVSPVKIDK